MSKTQIVRKSFNGGEIAPDLWYRSDLEAYHSSCKSLLNMNVTPWGGAERRPPTELLAKIDTATYGVPVKYLPFKFSLTETFHVVFTDGSGSASPSASTADLIVFDSTGTLATLEGASTKILDTVYDPDDLLNLHYIQVNDFVYMTCGGSYPVQALNRFFDDAQSANRWTFDEFDLIGGPKGDDNIEVSKKISCKLREYDAAETYAFGDSVVAASADTTYTDGILSISYVAIGASSEDYLLWIHVDQTTYDAIDVGSVLQLNGVGNVPAGSVPTFTHNGFVNVSGKGESGAYNWIKTDRLFTISGVFGITTVWDHAFSQLVGSRTFSVVETGSGAASYSSATNSNTGNALSDASSWTEKSAYSGELDLIAGFEFFTSEMVGSKLALRDTTFESLSGSWTSNQESISFPCFGTVELVTEGGAWEGKLRLMESQDYGTTWEEIGFVSSAGGASNGSVERDVSGVDSLLKVELVDYIAQTGFTLNACAWRLAIKSPQYRFFRITSVTDSRNAVATTENPVRLPVLTYKWARGEYSEDQGYPNALTIHDERMVFGGSALKPNTVWASRVNDWSNFLSGDTEVSPYTFTVKSDSFDTIRWMRSTRKLMVGTENSETTMGTRDDTSVISPTNIDVQTHTYFGSDNLQAVVTADLVFFVQGQSKRVRSTQYDFASDQYLSSEMSIYAHHITGQGIKEMSFTRDPYSLLFFTMEDGKAVTFTYERDNAVKGWARLELGGSATMVSAASNYTPAGDSVFGIVLRNGEYALEGFTKTTSASVYLDGQIQFVDEDYSAGVAIPIDATGAVVIRNDVLLDPADYTIAAGTLTIPGETDGTVTVGWPVSFEVAPTNPLETGDFGVRRRVEGASLYLLDSGGCDVSINGVASPFQDSINLAATARLDGEYELSINGGYDSKANLVLSGNHHRPFKILGVGFDVSRHS